MVVRTRNGVKILRSSCFIVGDSTLRRGCATRFAGRGVEMFLVGRNSSAW